MDFIRNRSFVLGFLRHDRGCRSDPLIGPSVIGEWHGFRRAVRYAKNQKLVLPRAQWNPFYFNGRRRFKSPNDLRHILHGRIRNGLADNLGLGPDPKDDLPATTIQERTKGLARTRQLAPLNA